ncbi:hypothetical protein NKR23_g10648 [Pleurostoma richardsiae]|uniref:Proteinase inhibitor, propeptide n=1 Tax=Pleurostoma richardsiae TaxID=41990 RepID=A0AA38R2H1_9PEZI|nr:hypothetical protein NKR23_g10648 [Pleurostoma richardsiae]
MKLIAYLLALLTVVSGALAVDVQKAFIVSYPSDTPNKVVDQAKKAVLDAGGVITHEYHLIKGFAATAGEKVFQNLQAMGSKYNALVEEDQVVSVAGSS